ncbi:MAG: sugar phosphate nucleotidyltransferase [Bacteroidota bacterium]|nr:sugar phosphate nucleotidyltransferase [Bacteroidota bacterium]
MMTKDANTIILCGGKINFSNLPISSNTNNSMIPVNGKPVISWIIEDLIKKNFTKATIVLLAENLHLKEFLQRAFQSRINLQLVELVSSSSILHSLQLGLQHCNDNYPSQVILGDTLLKDPFGKDQDFVYVQEVEDSKRWCIAIAGLNGEIITLLDKQDEIPKPHLALCGYYYFKETSFLKAQLHLTLSQGKKQMSDLLLAYKTKYKIKAKRASQWFDFGNIDNLINAKQRLLQSRYFNALSIDPILNTITKISDFDKKLRNELNWYKQLPVSLQVLAPRIISEKEVDGKLNLVQEYYGYPTLAELYLFSDLGIDNWRSIFKRLLTLHQTFQTYPYPLSKNSLQNIYLEKTNSRVAELCVDPYWENMFSKEEIVFNEIRLQNFGTLRVKLNQAVANLIKTTKGCIIHGDFCFSNILYDLNNQIIRLIDPRGSFGETGIYGDPRYDMAKLRHSIAGNYDYIVSDLFEISETSSGFEGVIFVDQDHEKLIIEFDNILKDFNYRPEEITLIEGLLFISMLPLHRDKPARQKMMYIKGLQLLNKTLCE